MVDEMPQSEIYKFKPNKNVTWLYTDSFHTNEAVRKGKFHLNPNLRVQENKTDQALWVGGA